MHRSFAARSGTTGMRAFSTTAAPAPNAAPGAGTPATPKPPSGGGAAPPPPPAQAPPKGSGFLRRATPLVLGIGSGYFFYRIVTDNEFRASVQEAMPAAKGILERIPTMDAKNGSVVKDAAVSVEANRKSNLPPGYDSVPQLLKKIEESAPATSPFGKDEDSVEKGDEGVQDTETVKKAKVKGGKLAEEAGDGAMKETKVEVSASDVMKKARETLREADGGAVLNVVGEEGGGKVSEEKMSLVDVIKGSEEERDGTSDDGEIGGVGGVESGRTSGKDKLQRLLGKGDFQSDKVDGPDVVDDSVYKKPGRLRSSEVSSTKGSGSSKGGKSWGGIGKKASWVNGKKGENGDREVLALKAELESQMKWEAVRLQEAVRAQMVEDKKLAAKEAAALAKRHGEEVERVREQVMADAEAALKRRTAEIQKKANKERDADLMRLLKVKEAEMREMIAVEYADKERFESVERSKQLLETKAEVGSLVNQFDAVVRQTEKAKEAAKRASWAYILRDTVAKCRAVGDELGEASGKSELGRLVAESIPEIAMKRGISCLDSLKEDFGYVSRRGLSVAMVPEGRTGTIWGHLLGAVFSRLKIPIDSCDDEMSVVANSNEERIRRAGRLVNEGDLEGAIMILEGLNGLSKDVMRDWLNSAKARVAADLAVEVLVADAVIGQIVMGGGTGEVEVVSN